MISRLSADLLQMFQQICSRLKTDLLVSYGNGFYVVHAAIKFESVPVENFVQRI